MIQEIGYEQQNEALRSLDHILYLDSTIMPVVWLNDALQYAQAHESTSIIGSTSGNHPFNFNLTHNDDHLPYIIQFLSTYHIKKHLRFKGSRESVFTPSTAPRPSYHQPTQLYVKKGMVESSGAPSNSHFSHG